MFSPALCYGWQRYLGLIPRDGVGGCNDDMLMLTPRDHVCLEHVNNDAMFSIRVHSTFDDLKPLKWYFTLVV
jgi:hypothetical protein